MLSISGLGHAKVLPPVIKQKYFDLKAIFENISNTSIKLTFVE